MSLPPEVDDFLKLLALPAAAVDGLLASAPPPLDFLTAPARRADAGEAQFEGRAASMLSLVQHGKLHNQNDSHVTERDAILTAPARRADPPLLGHGQNGGRPALLQGQAKFLLHLVAVFPGGFVWRRPGRGGNSLALRRSRQGGGGLSGLLAAGLTMRWGLGATCGVLGAIGLVIAGQELLRRGQDWLKLASD